MAMAIDETPPADESARDLMNADDSNRPFDTVSSGQLLSAHMHTHWKCSVYTLAPLMPDA